MPGVVAQDKTPTGETVGGALAAVGGALVAKEGEPKTITNVKLESGLREIGEDIEVYLKTETLDDAATAKKMAQDLKTLLPTVIIREKVVIRTTPTHEVLVTVGCKMAARGAAVTLAHYGNMIAPHNLVDLNKDEVQLIEFAHASKICWVAFDKVACTSTTAKNKYTMNVIVHSCEEELRDYEPVKWLTPTGPTGVKNRQFWKSGNAEAHKYGGRFHRRYNCAEEEDTQEVVNLFRKAGIYCTEYVESSEPVYGALGAPPADLF